MDWAPGTLIAGRYRADRRIGMGGMGEVWQGEHLSIGCPVAMKTLLPAAAINHEVVARFKREAYFLGRLRSDHVARILDFVEDDEYGLVLVMEYVEGDSLAQVLQKRKLTFEEAVEIGTDVTTALCELHAVKIVHRDLKPGNIILRKLPEGGTRAVIVDFGVSRLLSDAGRDEETLTGITKADMALGTLEYMAPEQVLNSRDVTQASDVYALGAMMYRAIAGRHIFGNNVTDEVLARKKLLEEAPALGLARTDDFGKRFEAVITKAVKRRPSERYHQASEMLAELGPLRDELRASRVIEASTTEDTKRVLLPPVEDIQEITANTLIEPPSEKSAPMSTPSSGSVSSPTPLSGRSSAIPLSAPATATTLDGQLAPRNKGISAAVLVAAVLLAAGGGVYLGTVLNAPQSPAATAAPAPTASANAAAPSASAAPAEVASAPVEDDTVVIQDLDPASAAALGLIPGPEPAAPKPIAAAATASAPTSPAAQAPAAATTAGSKDPEPSIDDDATAKPAAPPPTSTPTATAKAPAKPAPTPAPTAAEAPKDVGNPQF